MSVMQDTPLPKGDEERDLVVRRGSKVGVYHWREFEFGFEWRCDCDASRGMPRYLNEGDDGWEWAWTAK